MQWDCDLGGIPRERMKMIASFQNDFHYCYMVKIHLMKVEAYGGREMLKLYEPHMEDLWFREQMMSDEQTMAYNHAYGGTISFPKENWADWYDRWLVNHNGKRFYRYLKENDTFIGEVAYHIDEERQTNIADVMIYAPYRQKGYGRKALQLLCQETKEMGIHELYDDVAIDNSSVELFF